MRSEQVFWPAGSIDFQGLGRRGHSCRQCLRDRGRAGLNLLLSSWFARARVQRRVAACGVSGSIYFQGLDWRGRAPRACVVARGSGGSIYFQGLDWRAVGAQSEGARSEHLLWPAGARGPIYFQGLGRRGQACRACGCGLGRAGLNLLPGFWSARAGVQSMCCSPQGNFLREWRCG